MGEFLHKMAKQVRVVISKPSLPEMTTLSTEKISLAIWLNPAVRQEPPSLSGGIAEKQPGRDLSGAAWYAGGAQQNLFRRRYSQPLRACSCERKGCPTKGPSAPS